MGMNAVLGFLKWDLKHSYGAYEKYYMDELRTAFSGQEGQRKLLVYCFGLYHEKRFAQALEPLESLLRRCRNDEDRRAVLLARALCQTDLGRVREAEQSYLELLKGTPDYATARSNLGLLLLEQGRYRMAEQHLRRAVELEKDNAHARLNLGTLYFRTGQYEKAIPVLKEAAELNEKLFNACTALARCYAALDMPEQRDWYFELAVHRGQDPERLRRALQNTASVLPGGNAQTADSPDYLRGWQQRTGKPSLVVGLSRSPMGRSYIGGSALGQPPLDEKGKPMRQLAAIYCEEFPGVGLPEDGLIRIFIADNSAYGASLSQPNVQTGFRVLYDREYDHLKPGAHPGRGVKFPVLEQYGLQVHTRVNQPMPAGDYRFPAEFAAHQAKYGPAYSMDDFAEQINDTFHRIGGYPCFEQGDPRCDGRYAGYDTLLFQLDGMVDSEYQIILGDGEVLRFLIPAEKLAAGDVSDVLYWVDC